MSDSEPPAKRIKIASSSIQGPHSSISRFDLEKLYTTEIVTINVSSDLDPEDEEIHGFTIPRALICGNSAYFQGAFKGGFQESETKEISIDDTDWKVFACFINFLYTRSIVSAYQWESAAEQSTEPSTWQYSTLFALYIFADKYKYDSKDFRMAVFEKIQHRAESFFPTATALALICENLLPSSPLYRFVIHCRLSPLIILDGLHTYPAAFMAECLDQAMRRSRALSCVLCQGYHGSEFACVDTTHRVQDSMYHWGSNAWCQFHEHAQGRGVERVSCGGR